MLKATKNKTKQKPDRREKRRKGREEGEKTSSLCKGRPTWASKVLTVNIF